MSRAHPYDLVFAPELESKLDAIAEEATERDVDPTDADRLGMLLGTGEVLRELLPEDASTDAIQQIARLVFHCFHYRMAGKLNFDIAEDVLRELLATGLIAGPGHIPPPAVAGYVTLPRNRVWSRITEDAHPEAIDGFFFTGDQLLFILGLMQGRPGFSIMEVSAAHASEENVSVADLKARAEGEDFANVLPGGELQGHFAITNTAEALKLAARCFWQLSSRDG